MEIRTGSAYTIDRNSISALVSALKRREYTVIGPLVRDGAVVYDEISDVRDLPVGCRDDQRGGHYSLRKGENGRVFGYSVGPYSLKNFLFPPHVRLFSAHRNGKDIHIEGEAGKQIPGSRTAKYAFLGIRPCDLRAMQIQDKVLSEGQFLDPYYRSIREQILTIVVNCAEPGGTCFCASMKTGPRASGGYDIALTEVLGEQTHYFVADIGSDRGEQIVKEIECRPATQMEIDAAHELLEQAGSRMCKSMDVTNIRDLLYSNFDHPRWDAVAKRCLSCTNCTMVCPTCFCSSVEDVTDLTGQHAERWRKWDSCFTVDFSYIHGGSIRPSVKSRYRQWLTHKLASWTDQFGTSGCVGCGRCITWCPVGIDITEEVQAIRDGAKLEQSKT